MHVIRAQMTSFSLYPVILSGLEFSQNILSPSKVKSVISLDRSIAYPLFFIQSRYKGNASHVRIHEKKFKLLFSIPSSNDINSISTITFCDEKGIQFPAKNSFKKNSKLIGDIVGDNRTWFTGLYFMQIFVAASAFNVIYKSNENERNQAWLTWFVSASTLCNLCQMTSQVGWLITVVLVRRNSRRATDFRFEKSRKKVHFTLRGESGL